MMRQRVHHFHLRHTVPGHQLAVFGLLIVLPLLTVHAAHLADVGRDYLRVESVRASHGMHETSVVGTEWSGGHNGVDCPTPEWVGQREQAATDVGYLANVLGLMTPTSLAPARLGAAVERLPLARGPDRQAILQRFTL